MKQFADEAIIEVTSGKGGNGCVSFRREKYVPMGGPNGGDGGKGGDVIFCVKRNVKTLANIRFKRFFKAKNGGDGMGWNKYGKDGEDVVIAVPPGTAIRDAETKELIKEFTTESEDEQFVFLKGGNGGWGNVHFKSSTNQAPRTANKGQPGEYRKLLLELSIMADIGLVGFPNAGKSSLLDAFTNARPKIAPYPFTTKIPNLGVLRADAERDVIIADIPGIIEGASEGAGLGIRFLKHISRTAGLLFMIDCSDENCLTAYKTLCTELEGFSKDLLGKPHIVLCNKIDIEGALENAEKIAEEIKKVEPDTKVIPVSVAAHKGMNDVRIAILELVTKMAGEGAFTSTGERVSDGSFLSSKKKGTSLSADFLATRSVDEFMEEQFPGQDNSGLED
ncbi:GTPase ObgE [uncultured Treponema sp.]|uniref:GTPase ObgE n=1 Tax=uncultured Treponema sp. TaxID=162155 RepID=UPI0025EAF22E|nr:GTPase ObgE [uncultured Treponema sp.]